MKNLDEMIRLASKLTNKDTFLTSLITVLTQMRDSQNSQSDWCDDVSNVVVTTHDGYILIVDLDTNIEYKLSITKCIN